MRVRQRYIVAVLQRSKDMAGNYLDLVPKGSAFRLFCGGLASFLHCDDFGLPPSNASVKCLSDAGFFLDERDIALNHTMRAFYRDYFLAGYREEPESELHRFLSVSEFMLLSPHDVFQFHHSLVPPSADLKGHWNRCKLDPAACSPEQIQVLLGLNDMIEALRLFTLYSRRGGVFVNSCFAHCQSELQDTWFAVDSQERSRRAVGDWYFSRKVTKEIDSPYPCDKTCHNLIP
ncbi:hypothetical protein MLD38_008986 [Melastoma candidum]|uniref:Uncharacterized protein n=1 Tax=Melastoma candidum TaxID=119954 RepID=A0ACB9RXI1_9MYRT|nr:hypothetical protein MLD38_008986 [Melastoma candidum]